MRLSRTPWLSGTYLIFISLFWLLNAGYFYAQRVSAPLVYSAGQDVLTEARNGLNYLQKNDPGNLTEHRIAYEHLQRLLEDYKAKHIDRIPLTDILVSVLAGLTALIYLSSGVALFLRRGGGAWLLVRAGMTGIVFHYAAIIADFIFGMGPINEAVNRLLDVFGIQHSGGGVTGPVIWIGGGLLMATMVFYMVVPYLLWRRWRRLGIRD